MIWDLVKHVIDYADFPGIAAMQFGSGSILLLYNIPFSMYTIYICCTVWREYTIIKIITLTFFNKNSPPTSGSVFFRNVFPQIFTP